MPHPDDRARPIPRRPPAGPAGDAYVVDTRRRTARPTAPPRGAGPSSAGRRRAASGPPIPPAPDPADYDEFGRPLPPSGPPPGPVAPARGRRPRGQGRRWRRLLLAALVLWLLYVVAAPVHAWSTVSRADTEPDAERPATGSGRTYLLVGSDSREGLSAQDRSRLATGSATGRRTDSIILVHVPDGGGRSALISIPRDSYLAVPGNGKQKVNAAFAIGGPELLVQTLEKATGLRVDGYVEIGFGGFASVVDSVDGVEICVKKAIKDKRAGLDLQAGCQTLDGATSLGYVRARYSDPRGDLGRAERQREFLGAVMRKAATPSTVLVPWRWWGFTHSAAGGVLVGEDTSLTDAARVLRTLQQVSSGTTLSLVVPLSSVNATTDAGSSVLWDDDLAGSLFTSLREGQPLDAPPPGTDGRPSGG
ncbi:MAG: LCP family protein [Dermatophilaceae bacterium]